jgi:alpha-L-fucosidase 2
LVLWYGEPAVEWTEALPLGNGTMGAMVFGGVSQERLQLNESTIWTGMPWGYAHPGAVEHLGQIRTLLQQMRTFERSGDNKRAKELQQQAEDLALKEFMSDPLTLTSYQPCADLYLDFPTHEESSQYRRELDLSTGLSKVSYECLGARYTRASFASFPDKSIVTRISADKPGRVSFKVSLNSPHENYGIKSNTANGIVLAGQVEDGAVKFEVHLLVSATGGQIVKSADGLEVIGADSATLKIVAASNFKDYKTVDQNPAERCAAMLRPIVSKTFEDMYRAHLDDYQSLFNRASLFLGDSPASRLPTNERIENFAKANDNSLVTLLFQYGRYLLIAGSRDGSQPLNLQGIWNNDLKPAWGSKMTCNINNEMNYWPANLTGLPECSMSLFEALKDLAQSGSITAQEHYGANGWVVHHNYDIWRATAPVNKSNHGIWVGGSGWLASHIWEQFLFTGDLEFLKKYYPILKGAAQFYTEFLYEDEITGYLISGPSNSPENGGLVMGPTMDHQIIRSLFEAVVLASRLVGDDSDLPAKVAGMVDRVAPNMKGQHGQLQEWLEDKDNPGNTHRHVSHLWGVYPGSDITWQNQDMFDAARQSLIFRGDEATGWSMGWKINLWARFLDGDHALIILKNLITPAVDKPKKKTDPPKKAGLFPNMFDACPPFQIDGNFGACAGIAEMLLQSHIVSELPGSAELTFSDFNFLIHLLPALPASWESGSFKGLRARGGFEVSAEWEKGELKTVVIQSHAGNPCHLKVGGNVMELKMEKGEIKTISF